MPGASDSGHADDYKFHGELILEADDKRKAAAEGETDDQRIERESAVLTPTLRADVERVLGQLQTQAPGLSLKETKKILTTRAGRDALTAGKRALARVDDHLQSVTRQRNPDAGRTYGVYGQNPRSFGGVLRSLELSSAENTRIKALAEDHEDRKFLFSPFIEREVERARDGLAAVLGARVTSRAELTRAINVKRELLDESRSIFAAVRQHLYANLPDGKFDDDLRDYGFAPIRTGRSRGRDEQDDVLDDDDTDAE